MPSMQAGNVMFVLIDREESGELTFGGNGELAAVVRVPMGSIVKSVGTAKFLMVPFDDCLRFGWEPRDVLRAAVEGDRRFQLVDVRTRERRLSVERN